MCDTCKIYIENFTILKAEFEKQKQELDAERRANEETRLEFRQLHAQLDERKDDIKQVDIERQMMAAQCAALKENLERMEELHRSKNSQRGDGDRSRAEAERYMHAMKTELLQQSQKIKALTDEAAEVRADLIRERREKHAFKSDVLAAEEKGKGLQAENAKLAKNGEDLQNEAIRLRGLVHRLESELEEVRTEHRDAVEEFTTERERSTKEKDVIIVQLRAKVEGMDREREHAAHFHATAEANWRQMMAKEREEFNARQGELSEKITSLHDNHRGAEKDRDRRITQLKDELAASQSDAGVLREQRHELEEKCIEATARAERFERAEEHARTEFRQVCEELAKTRVELDRHMARVAEARKNEAKIALLDMKVQYKERELLECKHESQALTQERGKVFGGMRRLIEKEQKNVAKEKKKQEDLLLLVNTLALQNQKLEDKCKKVQADFSAYKRNAEVRLQAQEVLEPAAATPPANPQTGFLPDSDVFRALTENFQKTAELEKLTQVESS
eukprot:TRINITY_DN20794_c0_g1_i1.p2 TRINITY_DN20794_c0_g1~~TRINITY_DN20794_c0_g1_i1.p2  ORF type:complete len:507 (+),score=251.81 TRINITY_DN20794_c0_g1_i1:70-1590(+)